MTVLLFDELAEYVVAAGLRFLDAWNVLRAGDVDVIGEALGGHASAVVTDQSDGQEITAPRLGEGLDHVA